MALPRPRRLGRTSGTLKPFEPTRDRATPTHLVTTNCQTPKLFEHDCKVRPAKLGAPCGTCIPFDGCASPSHLGPTLAFPGPFATRSRQGDEFRRRRSPIWRSGVSVASPETRFAARLISHVDMDNEHPRHDVPEVTDYPDHQSLIERQAIQIPSPAVDRLFDNASWNTLRRYERHTGRFRKRNLLDS